MKKKAKTQKTKTAAAKAKSPKASTTTKAGRGAKPKTKAATSGKAPRPTTERKQPKRGAQKAETRTTESVAATTQVEVPVQPAITITAEEAAHAAPSPTSETEPATAESPKAATTKRAPAREKPATSDSRLPPVGSVLQKRDRHGAVRCECEVTAEGILYQGEFYRSLSAAAVAAAKELGLATKAINGFTFWGLAKPARPAADPLTALERAWDRYTTKVESVLEGAKAGKDGREPVLSTLQRHARVLKNLHDEVA